MRDSRRNSLAAAACLLAGMMLWLVDLSAPDRALAERLKDQVLRFHVVADSNRKEDQELKLAVRSYLLEEICRGVEPDASKEELLSYLESEGPVLTEKTDRFIQEQGFSYTARLEIGESRFPTKRYGDMVFPAGEYEAVKVVLGNGKGRNWWCVLYPSLCFVDTTQAVVPDPSKEQLQNLLSGEDYESLFSFHPDIQISFRLAEWWEALFP